jgi:hypothetical protein
MKPPPFDGLGPPGIARRFVDVDAVPAAEVSVTKSSDLENVTHGGKRAGSGRKPSHASPMSAAERQRASRDRKKAKRP